MTRCDECGAPLKIGDFPWCPHGKYTGGAIQDTLADGGGQWIENLGPQPVWVESKSQLKREAAKRGLKWEPEPQPKNVKVLNPDNDVRGRLNGGALPTYRTVHRPDTSTELPET